MLLTTVSVTIFLMSLLSNRFTLLQSSILLLGIYDELVHSYRNSSLNHFSADETFDRVFQLVDKLA